MVLRAGGWGVEVEPSIAELASTYLRLGPFEAPHSGQRIKLARARSRPERARPFVGSRAEWGFFEVEGREVRVAIPDSVEAAESALRIAWALATRLQGGCLIHSSGVAVGDRALVATGPSTAGKSTLAELAVSAGATLMSDEIIQILPGGRCSGTPFHSSLLMPGSAEVRNLALCVRLEKRSEETLCDAPAFEMAQLLCSQAFVHEEDVGPLRRRVLQLFENARFGTLGFRKHPDAGRFVVDLLASGVPNEA